MSKNKTKCNLYFKEKIGIELDRDIPVVESGDGLYKVIPELSGFNRTEYRYAGSNPSNYVKFNNELWRIIGLVNVQTENGVEQRLKIIRWDGVEGQQNFGNYAWDRNPNHTNNWTTSKLKDMLNGIYYNSTSGECYTGQNGISCGLSTCDFSENGNLPKGLDENARNMIDKDVIWNIGSAASSLSTSSLYISERSQSVYGENPSIWSNTNDSYYHNGVGILYASDYGYAVGGNFRTSCLNSTLYEYSNENCKNSNWLFKNGVFQWLLDSNKGYSDLAFFIGTNGLVNSNYGIYDANAVSPVVYLKPDVHITNGEGTVDVPYELKYLKNAVEYINNKAKTDTVNLAYDETNENNLRYIGSEPNNYVDIGDRDNAGNPILWRIIGVMNNITSLDDGEKQESLIKIIRDDSIGSYSWDSSPKSINNGYGINEWSQADLMKLLNPKELYLDEPIIGKSLFWNKEKGKCYSSAQEINKDCDFNNNGISASAKVKLAKVRWNTGTFTSYDLSEWSAKNTYVAERSNNDGKKQCFGTNNETCNDDTLRTTTWDGYLALMYPSDYGYAVGGEVRNACLAKSMYEYSGNNCFRNDWLILNNVAWTLTPVSHSSLATCAFYISKDGYIGHGHADIDYAVRPAGYLKSTIKIVENSNDNYGSKGNPFIIY